MMKIGVAMSDRALSEYILCGLHLVSDTCGIAVALRVQDLQDNLTSLVFNSKCDAGLKPLFPGPVATLDSVDLMPAAPSTVALVSLLVFLLPVFIVLVKRLMRCKK
ncbi:uncharacterized protein LOC117651492 [Thrips palmi]|uniref:Uncharacterized protein LOC117651492 n=1 Tax=Thrips palmi TaxID=161013 RepID=A0A6P9A429_THRPL|nr:uncharacterized protein LOC117651492 [Thrips palmi]